MPALAFLGSLAGKLMLAAVGLVLTAGIAGVSLYASDFGVEATVVDKSCSPLGESTVTVKEKLTRFDHTQPIGFMECGVVQDGNFVKYNVRSERVRIWEFEGGRLLWDSATFG